MKKILDYIQFGKGTGKKYLFFLAVIWGGFFSWFQYYQLRQNLYMPTIQAFLSNLPTIEIKDGTLVSPADTFQIITFEDPDNTFTLTVDTRVDTLPELNGLADGFYLTRKAFYYVHGKEVSMDSLETAKDVKIGQGEYTLFFRNLIRNTFLMIAPLAMLIAFVLLYIASFLYAFASYAATAFMKPREMPFGMRRRAGVVGMILGYLFFVPLTFIHVYLSTGAFFVVVFAFESLFLYEISKRVINPVDNVEVI